MGLEAHPQTDNATSPLAQQVTPLVPYIHLGLARAIQGKLQWRFTSQDTSLVCVL
ncbi:hypothetical protein XAP412_70004 [Xanthomonas phaseoli pv. phaseoli]|uniref:Uncharacterized protein n=1 Tax=Xanthomonas campestris pv. phaseoli TaxID=317013 RepID=A0AB38DXJ8_XANCH|nr:hypothetical protein XAP6984_1540011 [Xanthomonas phaseoli pv. phaseoli]SON83571.1 hypothetical protein XAP7430_1470004 [Xanthomonas phaseoli pv. phaseoli]SON89088.1 hypothetical protein XAP412_70004 [Xanthomonas phaseoli pv. phaseoli]SOO27307.1 hypothetical protein XAP6164_150003 [Xanthomonas phaseoli pv. phaseoli]